MVGIYKITNPLGQIYIGQTCNLRSRYFGHKNPTPCKSKLYHSFQFYGFDNHTFEFIYECEIKDLIICEDYFINKYKPYLNYILKKKQAPLSIDLIENPKLLIREGILNFKLYIMDNGVKKLLERKQHCAKTIETMLNNLK